MAIFSAYLPLLQQVEGGFQKLTEDPGNYNSLGQLVGTNYGISARFYEGIINRPPSEQDIRNITKSQAATLYRQKFWNSQRADEIISQPMANTIIDHHVNSGRGAQLAQQTLNRHFGFNLVVDNQIGNNTLSALNSVNESRFVELYNEGRANHYRSIGNETFIEGWLKRLESFGGTLKKKM